VRLRQARKLWSPGQPTMPRPAQEAEAAPLPREGRGWGRRAPQAVRAGTGAGRRSRSDPRSAGCRGGRTGRRVRSFRSGRSSRRRRPLRSGRLAAGSSSRDASGSLSNHRPSGSSRFCRSPARCLRTRSIRKPVRRRARPLEPQCRSRGAGRQRTDRRRERTSAGRDLGRATSTRLRTARPREPPRTRRSGLGSFASPCCLVCQQALTIHTASFVVNSDYRDAS
jgi:hypothetical protein